MPEAAGAVSYGRLLSLPVPRRLALASLPADFADWLDYAAVVALLVFVWGEGPFVLALFAIALTTPYVVAGPLVAVFVDRLPLRPVLIASNLGRAVATGLLIVAPDTVTVLALVFLRGCVDSAFGPARQSAIKASTPEALLGIANGLHQAINQLSKIVGPAVGGLILAVMPAQQVFGINAVLSLIAAGLLLGLDLQRPPSAPGTRPGSIWRDAGAGIAEFARNRLLLAALIFSAIAYFSMFLYDALIALLLTDLGFDATAFGISIGFSGFGGLLGAVLAGRFVSDRPLIWMAGGALAAGLVAVALAVAIMAGLPVSLLVFYGAMLVMGGTSAFMLVPYRTAIQSHTPPDRLARVVAAGEAVTIAVMVSAPFVGSMIAATWGTPAAFMAGGLGLTALGATTAVVMIMRRL